MAQAKKKTIVVRSVAGKKTRARLKKISKAKHRALLVEKRESSRRLKMREQGVVNIGARVKAESIKKLWEAASQLSLTRQQMMQIAIDFYVDRPMPLEPLGEITDEEKAHLRSALKLLRSNKKDHRAILIAVLDNWEAVS